jgi:hypothetical protein
MPETSVGPLTIGSFNDEQRRGGACARCGLPVSTGSAVDLGERLDADGVRLFPRAHGACLPGGTS